MGFIVEERRYLGSRRYTLNATERGSRYEEHVINTRSYANKRQESGMKRCGER